MNAIALLRRAAGLPADPERDFQEKFERNFAPIDVEPEKTIIDRAASSITKFLDECELNERTVETEIASLQEKLRQIRVVKAAFKPTMDVLIEGNDGPVVQIAEAAE